MNPIKKYFIVAAILFFASSVRAQDVNTVPQNDTRIPDIDKLASEIKSNISSYQKKEWSKDSTGYRHSYFNNGELVMAVTYYKDTATEKHGEWYFKDGKFIFSMKLWTDVKTKDTIDYERFYLSNERLIAWYKFNISVDRNTVAYKKLNYMMRDYIADLRRENEK